MKDFCRMSMLFFLLLLCSGCGEDSGGGSVTGSQQNGDGNGDGAPTLLPAILLLLSGIGDGGIGNHVEIIWVNEPQPLLTYVYSAGVLSAINFHRNFVVVSGSGNIQISADLKDHLDSMASIDQIQDTFYVVENLRYEIIVDVSVGAQIRCTPSDYDFMIFDSPSAQEPIDTAIPPMLEGDPTTNQIDAFCLTKYVIDSIRLN